MRLTRSLASSMFRSDRTTARSSFWWPALAGMLYAGSSHLDQHITRVEQMLPSSKTVRETSPAVHAATHFE